MGKARYFYPFFNYTVINVRNLSVEDYFLIGKIHAFVWIGRLSARNFNKRFEDIWLEVSEVDSSVRIDGRGSMQLV